MSEGVTDCDCFEQRGLSLSNGRLPTESESPLALIKEQVGTGMKIPLLKISTCSSSLGPGVVGYRYYTVVNLRLL
jgi:hypothetical protein